MDKKALEAQAHFVNLAQQGDAPTRAGRVGVTTNVEGLIFREVFTMLRIRPQSKVASIGAGCGTLAQAWLHASAKMDLRLTLVDFPAIVAKVKQIYADELSKLNVELVPGKFPDDAVGHMLAASFDAVDLYSVVQYTDEPATFIESAVNLLAPGGRLFVGDIPNPDKLGRQLSTRTGRALETEYRKMPLGTSPGPTSIAEFKPTEHYQRNPHLGDAGLLSLIKYYRDLGKEVYLCEQAEGLPYSRTREDILIVEPNS